LSLLVGNTITSHVYRGKERGQLWNRSLKSSFSRRPPNFQATPLPNIRDGRFPDNERTLKQFLLTTKTSISTHKVRHPTYSYTTGIIAKNAEQRCKISVKHLSVMRFACMTIITIVNITIITTTAHKLAHAGGTQFESR
jgi:hypothetical protein